MLSMALLFFLVGRVAVKGSAEHGHPTLNAEKIGYDARRPNLEDGIHRPAYVRVAERFGLIVVPDTQADVNILHEFLHNDKGGFCRSAYQAP